jgi:DNA-binding HxlR family transcriptional regulator
METREIDTLTDPQREILTQLLRTGLRSRVIAEDLTSAELNARQVAAQLRVLAKQGLVIYIPSPAGSYWRLTAEGRCRTETMQLHKMNGWDLAKIGRGVNHEHTD